MSWQQARELAGPRTLGAQGGVPLSGSWILASVRAPAGSCLSAEMLAQQQLSRAGLSPNGHGCCPAAEKHLVWACLKSLATFLLGSKFSFNQKVCPHRSYVTRQAAPPASSLSRVLLAGSCWVGH